MHAMRYAPWIRPPWIRPSSVDSSAMESSSVDSSAVDSSVREAALRKRRERYRDRRARESSEQREARLSMHRLADRERARARRGSETATQREVRLPRRRIADTQRRVIVVGRFICLSVGRSVGGYVYLFPRFLSNRGCCRYQTWICGYVQRALGTARVWSGVVQEQHVYGGGLKLYTVIILGVH